MRIMDECISMTSRRNDVRHCQWNGKDVIRKRFTAQVDYLQEKSVYQNLLQDSPQLCPNVITFDDLRKEIILEYVSGVTVLEALEKAEIEKNQEQGIEIFTQLFDWMQSFYNSQKTEMAQGVMGDINLRNFIWVEQHIVGIDFEGSCLGDKSDEILRMMAFYLLYEPERTSFKLSVVDAMTNPLLKMTNRSVLLFWESVDEEIEKIRVRRQGDHKEH